MNTLTLDLRPASASTSRNATIARAASITSNTTFRAFMAGMTLAAVGSSLSNAEAQNGLDVGKPLKTIAEPVCQVYRAFTGVLGIGFLLCLMVFAGLKYAAGNSKATSQAIAAALGALIVFSARTALNLADSANGAKFTTACNGTSKDPTEGL